MIPVGIPRVVVISLSHNLRIHLYIVVKYFLVFQVFPAEPDLISFDNLKLQVFQSFLKALCGLVKSNEAYGVLWSEIRSGRGIYYKQYLTAN